MNQAITKLINRRFVLNQRPQGAIDDQTLRLESVPVPDLKDGEFLIRNYYLSLDPYMRGRMSDRKSYAPPVELNAPMVGGTVSRIVESRHPNHRKGDWIVTDGGWQDYDIKRDGAMAYPVDPAMTRKSMGLGVLGMPAFTAWSGLMQIGKPKAGETLVVAAALGPVGSVVGQIGKILGLRVIGLAGGAEKCRRVVEEFGFDACIDHRAPDMAEQLAKAAPDGIDIYFENVGGAVFDAVLPLLNPTARIPLCGNIVTYDRPDQPDAGLDRTNMVMALFQQQRITIQGFIVFDDFGHLYPDFISQMTPWVESGQVKVIEDMTDGLENAPRGLTEVLTGKNIGKKVIRIADDRA